MPSTSPGNPSLTGNTVSVHHTLNSPKLVPHLLNKLVNQRLIGGDLLTGRVDTTGTGSAIFQQAQPLFADRDAERIAELAEYPLTTTSEGPSSIVSTDKWGLSMLVSDELVARNRWDVLRMELMRLANSVVYGFDQIALSAIGSAVTETTTAAAAWNTADADPLLDVLMAKAAIDEENMGYNATTVVCTPTKWAQLVAATKVLAASPREAADSNVLSGNMLSFAGLNILRTTNLPSGVEVMVIDTLALGSVVWEDRGGRGPGGWQGDPSIVAGVESKVSRLDDRDGYRISVRKVQVPQVQEPSAARKITGV
jgi:hypothetical protein